MHRAGQAGHCPEYDLLQLPGKKDLPPPTFLDLRIFLDRARRAALSQFEPVTDLTDLPRGKMSGSVDTTVKSARAAMTDPDILSVITGLLMFLTGLTFAVRGRGFFWNHGKYAERIRQAAPLMRKIGWLWVGVATLLIAVAVLGLAQNYFSLN